MTKTQCFDLLALFSGGGFGPDGFDQLDEELLVPDVVEFFEFELVVEFEADVFVEFELVEFDGIVMLDGIVELDVVMVFDEDVVFVGGIIAIDALEFVELLLDVWLPDGKVVCCCGVEGICCGEGDDGDVLFIGGSGKGDMVCGDFCP